MYLQMDSQLLLPNACCSRLHSVFVNATLFRRLSGLVAIKEARAVMFQSSITELDRCAARKSSTL